MAIYRCAACGAVNRAAPEEAASTDTCARCRRPLDRTGRPQEVDAAALVSAILSSPAPVLVDFSEAPSAALEGLARSRAGEVVVLRVDPVAEPAAAAAYRVGTAPTLVLFSGGAEIARRAGQEQGDLRGWMEATRTLATGRRA